MHIHVPENHLQVFTYKVDVKKHENKARKNGLNKIMIKLRKNIMNQT